MSRSKLVKGYQAPAGDLAGTKLLVSPKSEKDLPTGIDREKEQVLPPGAATPNTVEKSNENSGDHTRNLPSGSYNTPANDIPDRPRTLPEGGADRGTTYKQDGNFVRRRTMLGEEREAYERDRPWKRQRRQKAEPRRKDHMYYVQNRSKMKLYQKKWHKKNKRKGPFKRKQKWDNKNEHRTKRKRADEMVVIEPLPFMFIPEEGQQEWVGEVIGLNPVTQEVVFDIEDETAALAVPEFLYLTTFFSQGDIDTLFDHIDTHIGEHAYDDGGFDWDGDELDIPHIVKMALRGYKPTKTRRRKWRGKKKTKGRRYERKRKRNPKRKQYMKKWNRKRNRSPAVKRQRARRRRNPARWRKRGSVLTTPEIAFVFGPELKLGYVHSVSPFTGLVTFVVAERDVTQLQSLPVIVFLEVIVPLTEQDADALLDLLEIEIGPEVYEDEVTVSDIHECARMYGVDPESSEFKEGCFTLTGLRDLEQMTPDQRSLVNGTLVVKTMEGGSLNRSPEDDLLSEGEEEEDDQNFYYGKVDLPEDAQASRLASRWLQGWEGTNWQYDQEAPDAFEPKDDTPHRPHQPDGPTTWRRKPQEKETPAPGSGYVPDSQNAPASSAKAPGGSYVSEGGYVGKTAATISEIVSKTDQGIHQRARGVRVRLSRADPGRGIWTFQAAGSGGKTYTIRVKGVRKGNTVKLSKAQVKCSCSCNFFKWQGPEHWAKTNSYLYGRARGTAAAPKVKDPSGKHWACKHLVAALRLAAKYRMSTEGQFWPQGIEIVPDYADSISRVADLWLGSPPIPESE
ncbi:hypothetical protein N9917_03155 [Deltaproteobacteria bacterium]|nr:hypothetical protein [Deltaproteobacteria bacterium]